MLVNVDVGFLGGTLVAFALGIGSTFGFIVWDGLSAGLLVILLIFLVIIARGGYIYVEAAHASGERMTTFDAEWREAFRWPWIVLVAVLVAVALTVIRFRYFPYWYSSGADLVYWGGFTISFLLLVITQVASADGSIDSTERTLTYTRHTFSTSEIELDNLTAFRMFTLGDLTVARFSFHPGTVSSIVPRCIVMPTETASDARPVLEQAVAHDPAEEPDPQVRRQLFAGAALLMGMSIPLVWMIYIGTGVFWFSAFFAGIFGVPGFIVLFIAFRS